MPKVIMNTVKRYIDICTRRDLEKLDEPIKAEKWVNNYFFKTTSDSFVDSADDAFPTEAAAKGHADKIISYARSHGEGKQFVSDDGFIFNAKDLSHAIQMPVKS